MPSTDKIDGQRTSLAVNGHPLAGRLKASAFVFFGVVVVFFVCLFLWFIGSGPLPSFAGFVGRYIR